MTKPVPRRKGQADADRMRRILRWLWLQEGRPVPYSHLVAAFTGLEGLARIPAKSLRALLTRMVGERWIKEDPPASEQRRFGHAPPTYTPLVKWCDRHNYPYPLGHSCEAES